MTEHTPGAWTWWTSNSWRRLRHSERGVSKNVLMPVVCRDGQRDIDVSQTDMKVIAAAPEMLAALKELAKLGREGMKPDYNEWLTFHDKVALIAESAIAKATVTESGPSTRRRHRDP
jgi:hypothetical protein